MEATNTMTKFDDFIFNPLLSNELKLFIDNPKKLPSAFCFYGSPGTGKTSFAKYLATIFAKEDYYIDMNIAKPNGNSFGDLSKRAISYMSTASLFQKENAVFEKCVIFDEWHNATTNQQDTFKVPFEQFSQKNHCLFILCLNTDKKNPLSRVLSPAIRSRCHCISFDSNLSQINVLTKLTKQKFPQLSEEEIVTSLPDFRTITRLAKLKE